MQSHVNNSIRLQIALFIGVFFAAGCSGSNQPQPPVENEISVADTVPVASDNLQTGGANITDDANISESDSEGHSIGESNNDNGEIDMDLTESVAAVVPTSRQIDFSITVPAYASNALQVRLSWGDKNFVGSWVVDEQWTASELFPINTEKRLSVTFYDENGAITLGRFEQMFNTASNSSGAFQIDANQFDTVSWDNDGDGVSNLAELKAGANPLIDENKGPVVPTVLPQQALASINAIAAKTFRITWQASNGAEFYRVLENPDAVSGFSQISGNLTASARQFDFQVALHKRVNASYIVQACNTIGCVDSDEQIVAGLLTRAIGYVKAGNADADDFFGDAVSLSGDGKTLAIGAPHEDSSATRTNRDQADNTAGNSGAVYVFVKIDGKWRQQAYLKASNTDAADWFGESVSLSADGDTLAVGARFEDSAATGINGNQNDDSAEDSGAVYILVRKDGIWVQQAYVKASNTSESDWFGGAVSLSGDGNTLAVGASSEHSAAIGINGNQTNDSARWSGAVYVYVRVNGSWQQQAYVKASNTDSGDYFGKSVSLSVDGNTLAVGADGENGAARGINANQNSNTRDRSGAVYVFVRRNDNWQQQSYIKASNTDSADFFGHAVALSANGDTLAVGAIWEDSIATGINANQNDNSNSEAGAVYVYSRTNNRWSQQAYLKASNSGPLDMFGYSVSFSANGDTLAIGSFRESSAATGINGNQSDDSAGQAGAAYLFTRLNGIWQQKTYLKASNSEPGSYFGRVVSLSADGNSLAIGAPYEDGAGRGLNAEQSDQSASSSGAVYLY